MLTAPHALNVQGVDSGDKKKRQRLVVAVVAVIVVVVLTLAVVVAVCVRRKTNQKVGTARHARTHVRRDPI